MYIQTVDHYTAMRMNNLKSHVVIWISLTNRMLTERSQKPNSNTVWLHLYKDPKRRTILFC